MSTTISIPEPKSLDQILVENPELKEKLDKKIDNVVLAQNAIRRDLDYTMYIVSFIAIVVVFIYLRRKDLFKSSKFVPVQDSSYHSQEVLQAEMSKDYYFSNTGYNCGFRKCSQCQYLVSKKYELAICPAATGQVRLHKLEEPIVVLKYNVKNNDFAVTPAPSDRVCCKHCGIVIRMDELRDGRCISGRRHESDGEIYDGEFSKVL
jgi:hypothetical protein